MEIKTSFSPWEYGGEYSLCNDLFFMANSNTSANSKKLAVNTILLYGRTFITMLVGLYTSRVVLEVLGVEDYGTYNVIGGIVTMFSVISASLSNSISRFLTYELGKGDTQKLRIVFSTSINIQIVLSIIIAVLVEIIAVWFLYNHMNIPHERIPAAMWVLQCSLITFVINLISVPYNAAIVAHEKMSAFAYISILESMLKLLSVYAIYFTPFDNLSTYAVALTLSALIVRFTYTIYCKRRFEECSYQFVFQKDLIKEMFSFAGWNFFGTSAYIFNTQGVNIISNMFFGVAVNAARGIGGQAEGAVRQFVSNFTTALNPQIIKTYAEKNYEACYKIVRQGAKFSYCLMLFFFIPIALEAEYVMQLWLKNVPEYAVVFWVLALLGTMVDLPGAPLTTLALATGKIKKFYIYMGSMGCLVFPLSWLFFYLGASPSMSYWVYIGVYTYLVFVRAFLLRKQIRFPVRPFLKETILPIIIISILSILLPFAVHCNMDSGFLRLVAVGIVSSISVLSAVWGIGMSKTERMKVTNAIKRKLLR